MFAFDLQRFAEGDVDEGQVVDSPESQSVEPSEGDAGPQQPDAGDDVQAGDGQNASQRTLTYTQEQFNRIIDARLMRERRQWEQKYNELKTRFAQIQQPHAPVNRQEMNRQFLAEFSKDPYGALERFADRVIAERTRQQAEKLNKAQAAARDALQEVGLKYPDFPQYQATVMQHISADPFLSSVMRSVGDNVTPELYAGVLERAYQAVKGQMSQAVGAAAGIQVTREQAALADQKRRAGVPRQSAASTPQRKSAEDILFEAMRNA